MEEDSRRGSRGSRSGGMESIVLIAEGREMADAVGIGCGREKSGEDGIRWHDERAASAVITHPWQWR